MHRKGPASLFRGGRLRCSVLPFDVLVLVCEAPPGTVQIDHTKLTAFSHFQKAVSYCRIPPTTKICMRINVIEQLRPLYSIPTS
jgi:hypothetical protein